MHGLREAAAQRIARRFVQVGEQPVLPRIPEFRARAADVADREEVQVVEALAIADEATIKGLEKYRDQLSALTDPRKTTEAQAQALLKTAKPIYYITSGIHSPENGGPEMLIELAYRLIVEETPFIQAIRNNVITIITPVIEVDGREKQVDTYYYNKTRAQGDARLLRASLTGSANKWS